MKMFFHCFQTQAAFISDLLIAAPIAHEKRQILFERRAHSACTKERASQTETDRSQGRLSNAGMGMASVRADN